MNWMLETSSCPEQSVNWSKIYWNCIENWFLATFLYNLSISHLHISRELEAASVKKISIDSFLVLTFLDEFWFQLTMHDPETNFSMQIQWDSLAIQKWMQILVIIYIMYITHIAHFTVQMNLFLISTSTFKILSCMGISK